MVCMNSQSQQQESCQPTRPYLSSVDEARDIFEYCESISPFSPKLHSLIQQLEIKPVDLDKVYLHLACEPGLVARILRLANSTFYGMPREVNDLREAIVIIGIESLKNILVTSVLVDSFQNNSKEWLNSTELWHHSIAVACCARVIARCVDIECDSEALFFSGILHDLDIFVVGNMDDSGENILFKNAPEQKVKYNKYTFFQNRPEEKAFIEIMFNAWNFPQVLVNMVKSVFDSEVGLSGKASDVSPESRIIVLAHSLATGLGLGKEVDDFVSPINEQMLLDLGLNLDKLKPLIPKVLKDFNSLKDSLM